MIRVLLIVLIIIIVLFFVFYASLLCKYVFVFFSKVIFTKRHVKSDKLFELRNKMFVYASIVVFLFLVLYKAIEIGRIYEQSIVQKSDNDVNAEVYSAEVKSYLEKINFSSEVTNEEETIWEHLLNDDLGLSNYQKWNGQANGSFGKLREKYQSYAFNGSIILNADFEEINEHIDFFRGTSLLPISDRPLEEITSQIPDIGERNHTPPAIFVEELYARSVLWKDSSTDTIYQVGRASDDALKQIVTMHQMNLKNMLFYSAISVDCFKLTLRQYEIAPDSIKDKVDTGLIYYRAAEDFIYLDKYCQFGEIDDDCSKHFKLSAETILSRIKIEKDPNDTGVDLNQYYAYYDDYYAQLLYSYIVEYNMTDLKTIGDFYSHANMYINSSYAKSKGVKDCNELKSNMGTFLKEKGISYENIESSN